MIIKISYNEPPLLVEAEIDGDHDDIADSADFFMARIAAMKKVLIKEAISADKSEESSEEDVFVWGVCYDAKDEDFPEQSWIFPSSPKKDASKWKESHGRGFQLIKRNLFPKDKPQKYRLVPVED